MAPDIITELGPHKAYWEPFCGSMAVLLSKPKSPWEMVNDLNGDLVNLARVIASSRHKELFERLTRTLYVRALFDEAKSRMEDAVAVAESVDHVGTFELERAYWYMVYSWMSRNGAAGTNGYNITMATRYTSNGGSGGLRWRSAVESVMSWHERLQDVVIENKDGFDLLERIEHDKPGSVIYCDPPYLEKSSKYIHDFEKDDHRRLAELLKRFKRTRVVLSYYDAPELRDWYDGWTIVDHSRKKGLANSTKRDETGVATVAPEILLINGPSFARGKELF